MGNDPISLAIVMLPPLFVSIILHEVAHGYVAELLGDPTARNEGRISLNPKVYIHPVCWLRVNTKPLQRSSTLFGHSLKPNIIKQNEVHSQSHHFYLVPQTEARFI